MATCPSVLMLDSSFLSVLRLAFVGKCRQTLGKVSAANVLGEGLKLCLKAVIAIRVEIGARKALDMCKHFRALAGKLRRDFLGAREELRRGHHLIDQAPIRELVRRE